MKVKMTSDYMELKTGDVIDVERREREDVTRGVPDGYYYKKGQPGERYLYLTEVEILPDDPTPSAAGGPAGATSMRTFETGATRSNDAGKIDPEGFLSPLVIERSCQYLNKHRVQADGKLRDSDNWQKGMGLPTYMKSAWRHFLDMWKSHRYNLTGVVLTPEQVEVNEDTIMAVLFNVMGYAHETIKNRITPISETK
jgi:hypothetical protein